MEGLALVGPLERLGHGPVEVGDEGQDLGLELLDHPAEGHGIGLGAAERLWDEELEDAGLGQGADDRLWQAPLRLDRLGVLADEWG